MGTNAISPSPPRSRQTQRACQWGRWSATWMWRCSWRGMLDGKWEGPITLYEMFLHAAEQGQKEVECMICCGHWHGLPKLDLKADVSAIQLVGPQTNKEEFRVLYYEVYKLRRLPGSPLGELEQIEELTAEIVSLPRRPPGVEGGWTIMEDGGTWSDWCPASKEQNPQEGEEGHFCWKGSCQGKGSPLEGAGYHGQLGGRDRVAEPGLSPRAGWRPIPTPGAGIAADRNLGDRTGHAAGCSWRRALPVTLNTTLPGGVQHLKKIKRLSLVSTWKFFQS